MEYCGLKDLGKLKQEDISLSGNHKDKQIDNLQIKYTILIESFIFKRT